jgi:dTDP-4-amino-4,6-dideoxygalactose transaminase
MSTFDRPARDAPVSGHINAYLTAMLTEPGALRGQQLRGGGPVAAFETLLAERCGFPFCVATCNATTTLQALALILNVRDRVVYFPHGHWAGSLAAFRLFGARVKRYWPQQTWHCRSADTAPPAAVVIGVESRPMGPLPGTLLIEDSHRIPGLAVAKDNRSKADVQVLSFGPGKPLSLGEGGAALFRDHALYRRFVLATQHPERAVADALGTGSVPQLCLNGRIHPVAALLGCELLRTKRTIP